MATTAITAAISIALGQLTQHSARVSGATNENQAAAQLAPAIQQDLQDIANAYSSGQISSSDAINAISATDQQTQSYLQKQQGHPGVAWSAQYNGPITEVESNPQLNLGQGVACNKNCTVGCCIYFNSWKPAFSGLIAGIQSGRKFSITVGPMQSNKYGFPGFPAYTISISPPPITSVNGVVSAITDAANLLTGQSSTSAPVSIAGTKINPLLIVGGVALLGFAIFLAKDK